MAEYTGYLAPWTNEIVQLFQAGQTPVQIADNISKPVQAHYEKDNRWNGYTPSPTGTMISYVLRRVGAMDPPPPIPVKTLEKQDRGAMVWRWYMVDRLLQREIAQRLGCSPALVHRIIYDHKNFLVRKELRENRERVDAEVYGPPLPPRILGRPLDMGGPRDVWLEQSPWDSL